FLRTITFIGAIAVARLVAVIGFAIIVRRPIRIGVAPGRPAGDQEQQEQQNRKACKCSSHDEDLHSGSNTRLPTARALPCLQPTSCLLRWVTVSNVTHRRQHSVKTCPGSTRGERQRVTPSQRRNGRSRHFPRHCTPMNHLTFSTICCMLTSTWHKPWHVMASPPGMEEFPEDNRECGGSRRNSGAVPQR